MDANVAGQIATAIGMAIASYVGTMRNRAKMGEVQEKRQAPIINSIDTIASRMDAKDRLIMEMSERIAAIERVSRRTEMAVKGGEMEPHTSPFLKSHEQLLSDEVKRRNKK